MCMVLIAMPLEASTEDVDVSVRILPMIPVISNPTLTDVEGEAVASLDVAKEYMVNFELMEKNGIEDIVSVSVSVFYAGSGALEPSLPDKRSSYQIVWENTGGGVWHSYPGGHLGTNTSFKSISKCLFEFSFPFILDKVSLPSGNVNTWKARIEVLDSSGYTGIYEDILFDVNDYVEWNGIPTQIDLTPIDNEPESPWVLNNPITIQTYIISNTEVDVYFRADDISLGDASIDPNSFFTICATNSPLGGSIAYGYDTGKNVPKSSTRIYEGAYSSGCTLNPSVDGYVDNDGGLVRFVIDVQDGKNVPCVPGGTYTASWYFSIGRGEGITL